MYKLVQNIIFRKSKNKKALLKTPNGVCPNCWGRQEWQGKAYEKMEEAGINPANKDQYSSFIKEFVKKYLQPISLKPKGNGYVCTSCN